MCWWCGTDRPECVDDGFDDLDDSSVTQLIATGSSFVVLLYGQYHSELYVPRYHITAVSPGITSYLSVRRYHTTTVCPEVSHLTCLSPGITQQLCVPRYHVLPVCPQVSHLTCMFSGITFYMSVPRYHTTTVCPQVSHLTCVSPGITYLYVSASSPFHVVSRPYQQSRDDNPGGSDVIITWLMTRTILDRHNVIVNSSSPPKNRKLPRAENVKSAPNVDAVVWRECQR